MKITEIKKSTELCSEAGWFAFDFFLEDEMTDSDILTLKPLGSFLYLTMLKTPFFKIEGDYFHIKGVRGEKHFRTAVHGMYLDYVDHVKNYIEETEKINPADEKRAGG